MMNKAERLSTLPYDIEELTTSKEFEHPEVVKPVPIEGNLKIIQFKIKILKEFSLDYIKRNGLSTPLFFNEPPEKLGMRLICKIMTIILY
jgi:hypothetical protein